jgi:hypothetical protein
MATNVLGNCGTLSPTFRASASPREIPDPSFLDCGGWTPLWISRIDALDPIPSSVKPEHSKTPSWPQNVLGNCGTLSPTLRASASPREIPDPCFLDCGGLTPLWIFPSTRSTPSQAPSIRSTPRHPHGHKTSWATAELYPQPFAPSRLRVRFPILLSWTAVAGHRFGFSPSTRLTSSKAPSSRSTPGHPHFHKTSWVTAELYP